MFYEYSDYSVSTKNLNHTLWRLGKLRSLVPEYINHYFNYGHFTMFLSDWKLCYSLLLFWWPLDSNFGSFSLTPVALKQFTFLLSKHSFSKPLHILLIATILVFYIQISFWDLKISFPLSFMLQISKIMFY